MSLTTPPPDEGTFSGNSTVEASSSRLRKDNKRALALSALLSSSALAFLLEGCGAIPFDDSIPPGDPANRSSVLQEVIDTDTSLPSEFYEVTTRDIDPNEKPLGEFTLPGSPATLSKLSVQEGVDIDSSGNRVANARPVKTTIAFQEQELNGLDLSHIDLGQSPGETVTLDAKFNFEVELISGGMDSQGVEVAEHSAYVTTLILPPSVRQDGQTVEERIVIRQIFRGDGPNDEPDDVEVSKETTFERNIGGGQTEIVKIIENIAEDAQGNFLLPLSFSAAVGGVTNSFEDIPITLDPTSLNFNENSGTLEEIVTNSFSSDPNAPSPPPPASSSVETSVEADGRETIRRGSNYDTPSQPDPENGNRDTFVATPEGLAQRFRGTETENEDTVDYSSYQNPVAVDLNRELQPGTLADGSTTSNAGDALVSIEDVIGGSGDDTIIPNDANNFLDGGAGEDTVSYSASDDRVVVDLSSANENNEVSPSGGYAEGDTLKNFENVIGSNQDDRLIGDDGDNVLEGGDGEDTLTGGEGEDTVSYRSSDAGVDVNLHTGVTSGGDADRDTLSGFENIIGSKFVDTLTGDDGDNVIEGGGDVDNLEGGGGSDTLSYENEEDAVVVLLDDGNFGQEATNKEDGLKRDNIRGFENVIGSKGDDIITGDAGDNVIEGGDGDDTLTGGEGEDTVSYRNSDAGVVVNLDTDENSGGHADGDTLSGFENIIGSDQDDRLIGDGGDNVIEGGGGSDYLDGGVGSDTLSYENEEKALTIDLDRDGRQLAAQEDDAGNLRPIEERIQGFENVIGGAGDDTISGDDTNNILEGGEGADTLEGRGGDDTLYGGAGADTYVYHFIGRTNGRKDGIDRIFDSSDGKTIRIYLDGTFSSTDAALLAELRENNYNIERHRETDDTTTPVTVTDFLRIYFDDSNQLFVASQGISEQGLELEIVGIDNVVRKVSSAALASDFSRVGTTIIDTPRNSDDHRGVLIDNNAVDTVSYEEATEAVVARLSTTLPNGVEQGEGAAAGDTFTNIANLIGSQDYGDTLVGDDKPNILEGRGGDDTLEGGAGDDILHGGTGDDTLEGGVGEDKLYGGAGDDTLAGGVGEETLDGGTDNLENGGKGDTANYEESSDGITVDLSSRDANNDIKGRGGDADRDTLVEIENIIGGEGVDRLTGDDKDNTLEGRGEADRLTGGEGDDTLYGGTGDDTLAGGVGEDNLYGGAGKDDLVGGTGDDILDGGDGDDDLAGGRGDDTYHYRYQASSVTNKDTITDADQNIEDIFIDLTGFSLTIEQIAALNQNNVEGREFILELLRQNIVQTEHVEDGDNLNLKISFGDDSAPANTLTINNFDNLYTGTRITFQYGERTTPESDPPHEKTVEAGDIQGLQAIDVQYGARLVLDANNLAQSLVLEGVADSGGDFNSGVSYKNSKDTDGIVVNLNANSQGRGTVGRTEGRDPYTDTLISIDHIEGSDEGDTITGNDNPNTLIGGEGEDKLYGGEGDDTLEGGDDDDTLYGGGGDDTLKGGEGEDTLYGGEGEDTLYGGEGDDTLDGGAGDDFYIYRYTAAAKDDKDTISQEADADNTIRIVLDSITSTTEWRTDLIAGKREGDKFTIFLRDPDDNKNADEDHTIELIAQDVLDEKFSLEFATSDDLNDAADIIVNKENLKTYLEEIAREGTDLIVVPSVTTSAKGTGSENTISFVDFEEADERVTLDLSGTSPQEAQILDNNDDLIQSIDVENVRHIIGSAGDDTLTGNDQDNTLTGGDGTDTLDGGAGGDTLTGGEGDDTLTGGAGVDTLTGGDGTDTLDGGAGVDTLTGGEGDDTLTGGEGVDTLYGGAGDDTLTGGAGNDILEGSEGNDVYIFEDNFGDDTIQNEENSGTSDLVFDDLRGNIRNWQQGFSFAFNSADDELIISFDLSSDKKGSVKIEEYSSSGTFNFKHGTRDDDTLNVDLGTDRADEFTGTDGKDYLLGFDNDDTLRGGDDDDFLYGGDGDDILLDGGEGEDTLYGEDGEDTLEGGADDDILEGGEGDDTLKGGADDDTYVYHYIADGRKDGIDTITDDAGDNIIRIVLTRVSGGTQWHNYVDFVVDDATNDNGYFRIMFLNGDDDNYIRVLRENVDDEDGEFELSLVDTNGVTIDSLSSSDWLGELPGLEIEVELSDLNTDVPIDGGRDTSEDDPDGERGGQIDFGAISHGIELDLQEPGDDSTATIDGEEYTVRGATDIVGGTGNDIITGNEQSNILQGGGGEDTLRGEGGNDKLEGGAGDDTLYGGAGKDTLDGGGGTDTLSYEGEDTRTGVAVNLEDETANDYDSARAETSTEKRDEIENFENVIGTEYGDKLTGDNKDNTLEGGEGNDILEGGRGNDILEGGEDNDILKGGRDDDTLRGDEGNDILEGGRGNDILEGGDDNDILEGGDGADTLAGGTGDDTALYDAAGEGVRVDLSNTGTQVDFDGAAANNNEAVGDTLSDIEDVVGSDHDDWLTGDSKDNNLQGGEGDDRLEGGVGADTLDGGTGADTLEGGVGADTLDGGAGGRRQSSL